MKKNIILLIAGIILSVLFIAFSTPLMESLYYEREFSMDFYNQSLYGLVATIDVAIAWAFAGLFYYVINSVSFSRWYHWLIMLALAAFLSAVAGYVYPNSLFVEQGLDYSVQLFRFALVNALLAAIVMVVASFAMRWWSSNCRHTPIPE